VLPSAPHASLSVLRKQPHPHSIDWEADEHVYVFDLARVRTLYKRWKQLFPHVQPFYAVKCNPDPEILRVLAECGANFDCASPAEIRAVLDQGVSPKRILYANPCKRPADIAFMRDHGVPSTTFDSICELDKIAKIAPETQCILRIYANDPTAQCILSNKFGAFVEEWDPLLAHAARLGLRVTGVSFHVGSGACNPDVFRDALQQARTVYELAARHGYDLHTIDIGGGFSNKNVVAMSEAVTQGIAACFADTKVQCIAEPGRYFVETVGTLYTKVIGVRERRCTRDVFITDSLYGSFNCILYDHVLPTPVPLVCPMDDTEYVNTTIFGPTCDGFDKICDCVRLPRLEQGSWLVWNNMGAYTIAGACDFNGIEFTQAKRCYVE
jgi:ornithine decarboxylase